MEIVLSLIDGILCLIILIMLFSMIYSKGYNKGYVTHCKSTIKFIDALEKEKKEKLQSINHANMPSTFPTSKEFETIVSSDGKELSEEGKKVNSLVYDALYSDDKTKRQNAINELKHIKDKELIKKTYKEHRRHSRGKSWLPKYKDNFAQVRKLIGIKPTVKSDVLNEHGRLKEEINVGTADDLPNDVFEKTASIIQKIEKAEHILDEVEKEPLNNSATE
ncbi:MAG: hypothetical protein KAQ92_03735 [Candidatus Aenigmarchaeota archaeon]|nr:hypothetical protein [Candidatus Aenigmarchaeota archaeon]